MDNRGFAYIPRNCYDLSKICNLIVVLHGCMQSFEQIGFDFSKKNGLNEWAESNDVDVFLFSPSIL